MSAYSAFEDEMTDFKGHNHGEYDDECPICYLDKALDDVIEERDALSAEGGILKGTIRDLQCSAMNYLTYPSSSIGRESLESAVSASLCIVPLDDASASTGPTQNVGEDTQKGYECTQSGDRIK